jgi:hypothetical protein
MGAQTMSQSLRHYIFIPHVDQHTLFDTKPRSADQTSSLAQQLFSILFLKQQNEVKVLPTI